LKREIILGSAALVGVAGSLIYQAGSFTPTVLVGELQAAGEGTTPASSSTPNPGSSNSSAPSSTPTISSTQTYDGDVYNTRYGPVQIQVTVTDGVIEQVTPLQVPTGRNARYTEHAIPILIQETLQAQSANISNVGGASYTSQGFVLSLQSALAKM
jgi:uncharacterized protein with FMN-binding domain